MGGCQNYGPLLGPYYNTAPNIQGTQKGTIILTTTHIYIYTYCMVQGLGSGLYLDDPSTKSTYYQKTDPIMSPLTPEKNNRLTQSRDPPSRPLKTAASIQFSSHFTLSFPFDSRLLGLCTPVITKSRDPPRRRRKASGSNSGLVTYMKYGDGSGSVGKTGRIHGSV